MDDFLILNDQHSGDPVFVFSKSIKPEHFRIIKDKCFDSIRIINTVYNIENLELFKELKGIRNVGIYNWKITSLDFLESYDDLDELSFDCNLKKEFKIKNLDRLRRLFLVWKNPAKNLLNAKNLEYLNIVNYPFLDINEILNCKKLIELRIDSRMLARIDNLEILNSLEDLYVFSSKLKSINNLENNKKLKKLSLSNTTSIEDYSILARCENLEYLELYNCGKIESLQFLNDCPNLKEINITGSTNIIDGKLSNILSKLSKHTIRKWRHYDFA